MTITLGEQTRTQIKTAPSLGLNWKDSPSTQHLLDAISSIIAREFIMIAKQNPAVFSGKNEIASGTLCPRKDGTITGGK
jgi:hypothetical protein